MALSVPLSRFTPRVGGGSAFFVRRLATMTLDTRHILAKFTLWFGLFCVWLTLVTFLTTISCIALSHWLLQFEQVRALVEHRSFLRVVLVSGIGVIWVLMQVYLGFLLPIRILKRRERVKHDAA